jgi:predicted GIY-YIG superfamily endonuclease
MNHYVYILRSLTNPTKTYRGETSDLSTRIVQHNTQTKDKRAQTRKHRPWKIETYVLADSEATGKVVEDYIKSNSFTERVKKTTGKKDGFIEFFSNLPVGTSFGIKYKFEVYGHDMGVPVFRMKPQTQPNV